MHKNNINQVLYLLVKELDIPVTSQAIENEIAKHPEHESLLAISELLNHWRIPNGAYNVSFEELAQVPVPFIAYFTDNEFAVVTRLTETEATVSNDRWKNHTMKIEKFKKKYNGSVLIAEKDAESGEMDYNRKHRQELVNSLRMPFFYALSGMLALLFLLAHTSYISAFGWQTGLLTLFKTAGVATAVLLLIQSIDANNPLISKLCSGGNKTDCNAILSSKAAKITDELSWSEAGFFYFAGTWLVLLFNSNHVAIIQSLAILNIVSLPYTFYSIYFQWRVAKQWCVFCCTVQALLWLEFFAFLPSLMHGVQAPDFREWISLATGMALPVLGWMLLKPYLMQGKKLEMLKYQLRDFKYNTNLFKTLLKDEKEYILPAEEDSIVIGNREAEHVITMVSNPYCQPCSRAHKTLDEWLAGRDDIKMQVVFSTPPDEMDDRTQVAKHLMSIQKFQDDVSLHHAMNDWYEQKQKDYDAWTKSYPVKEKADCSQALEVQREWCKTTEITGTPTIFINGRKLPNNYQLEDIRYFL